MIGGVLTALGWLALFLVLRGAMDFGSLTLVLGAVALAEVASAWAVAGWDDSPRRTNWADALERVLGRWIVFCVLFLGALQFGLIPFFAAEPVAVLIGLGMTLALALLKLGAACRCALLGRISAAVALRLPMVAAACLGTTHLGELDTELGLSIVLCIILVLLTVELWGLRNILREPDMRSFRCLSAADSLVATAPVLLRHADLMVLPFVLAPVEGAFYLVARGAASVISLAIELLLGRAAPGMDAAFHEPNGQGFVAAAARLNLGVLLVGGGAALGVLSAVPQLAGPLGLEAAPIRNILIWVVLGQAAPVFFGAVFLLLRVAGMRREGALLCLVGALSLGLSCLFLHTDDAILFAQQYASVQICVGLAGAAFLAWRTGIWPGLTAVLFRQIKLL